MKIDRLVLKHFRGIREIDIPFHHHMTVLVGVNGAGKSAVLDALAILLSWLVARVRQARGSGRLIRELDIQNRTSFAVIRAEGRAPGIVSWQEDLEAGGLSWQLVKTRQAHAKGEETSKLGLLTVLAEAIRRRVAESQEQCSIPLFAYYPINRAVLDIPLRIRTTHDFGLMEAWDESLTSAANFRSFFEWFRNREDLENENRRYVEQSEKPDDWEFPDRQLRAVRKALEAFLPEFTQFAVRRNPLRMTVLKLGEEIRVDQLSDGEKCLIALIGDLARRLAIANPTLANPLAGDGVVLIDELDLHLHPAWQRRVTLQFNETFPNVQFVVSTHSPQVISEVSHQQIRLLTKDENNAISFQIPTQSRGLTSNQVLNELMRPQRETDTLARNRQVEERLTQVFRLIDQEKFEDAKASIAALESELNGDIPDLVRAKSLLAMLETENEG